MVTVEHNETPIIGVLELQGAFAEHTSMLYRAGATRVVGVREASHLDGIDALVLPGGESTVQSKLLCSLSLMDRVRSLAETGLPMFGTCAGAILLAQKLTKGDMDRIGVLDVEIARNAYGAQQQSFEANARVEKSIFGTQPLRIVQIRAPAITAIGKDVQILAQRAGSPVLVRQGHILAATFHPELTDDSRVHRYFLAMVNDAWRAPLQ